MLSTILKSKLIEVKVTKLTNDSQDYCEIDGILLDAANIYSFEQVYIYNKISGIRFVTHAVRGKDNSGVISIHGDDLNKCSNGDILTISSYAKCDEKELINHQPKFCYVDESNTLTKSISTSE